MGRTTLYGVTATNELHEIYENKQGMAACLPIWNYFDNKHFPGGFSLFSERRPCWDLTPNELSKEEYFTLLTSFDGYYFERDHLEEMIQLLKLTHEREVEPIRSTRLEIFEEASRHEEYDKFFVTATSVADYEDYIDYHYDEESGEYSGEKSLKDAAWDIWEDFLEDIKPILLKEVDEMFDDDEDILEEG